MLSSPAAYLSVARSEKPRLAQGSSEPACPQTHTAAVPLQAGYSPLHTCYNENAPPSTTNYTSARLTTRDTAAFRWRGSAGNSTAVRIDVRLQVPLGETPVQAPLRFLGQAGRQGPGMLDAARVLMPARVKTHHNPQCSHNPCIQASIQASGTFSLSGCTPGSAPRATKTRFLAGMISVAAVCMCQCEP